MRVYKNPVSCLRLPCRGSFSSISYVYRPAALAGFSPSYADLKRSLDAQRFAALKREFALEMARIASTLHLARVFHKDFYLCHFFLDMSEVDRSGCRLILIDFHRLGKHRPWGARWRWKDLAQLLYSTFGVEGIDDRDRLRFWKHYRRLTGQRFAKWQLRVVRFKAGRYFAHNH